MKNSPIRWTHVKTGDTYIMEGIVLDEETLRPMVSYFQFGKPWLRWVRPAEHFFDGRFQPMETAKAKEPYDPQKPLEVDWDAVDLGLESPPTEGTRPSLLRPATAASQPSRVEDCLGNDLRIGDWVTLASTYPEDIKSWQGVPTKARKIIEITAQDGHHLILEDLPNLRHLPNAVKFYRRERQRMSPTEHA